MKDETIKILEQIEAEIQTIQVRKAQFKMLNELVRLAKAQHNAELTMAVVNTWNKAIALIENVKGGENE